MELRINLEPLREYLQEEVNPADLSKLLDELTFEYLRIVFRLLLIDDRERFVHEQTTDFLYHLKRLRDLFAECGAG